MRALRNLSSVSSKYVEDSPLPFQVVAIRKDGSVIEAGGKLLRTAVIALMAMLTNERVPKTILNQLLTIEDRVDPKIFEVL